MLLKMQEKVVLLALALSAASLLAIIYVFVSVLAPVIASSSNMMSMVIGLIMGALISSATFSITLAKDVMAAPSPERSRVCIEVENPPNYKHTLNLGTASVDVRQEAS